MIPAIAVTAVAAATAIKDAGRDLRIRVSSRISTIVKVAMTISGIAAAVTSVRALIALIVVLSDVDSVTPSAFGICCSAMINAMPTVNPSITGHGISVTSLPSPVMPMITTRTPAITATVSAAGWP